jgi:uncharacterized protein YkwD
MKFMMLFKFVLSASLSISLTAPFGTNPCVSEMEMDLYELIMEYRKEEGLKSIPLSASLTLVAQAHVKDLQENYKPSEKCNPHSWSKAGDWTSCCYTNDHKKAECMWDKPNEIAGYNSPGYEIAFWHSHAAVPDDALGGWKKSKSHNPVIVNGGQWKEADWNAIGVGIYQQYAVVWFGQMPDHRNLVPEICE